jgi:hypothetical protein
MAEVTIGKLLVLKAKQCRYLSKVTPDVRREPASR